MIIIKIAEIMTEVMTEETGNVQIKVQITRLLEHLKIRPTTIVLNTIYITLKNYGYKDIPKIQFTETQFSGSLSESGHTISLDRKMISKYCEEIKELIKYEPEKDEHKKKSSSKEVHIFPESTMLPQNVYVSQKGDEEKLEDNYVDEDITTASETEDSIISELEEQEEGYEYEENDDSEFSD